MPISAITKAEAGAHLWMHLQQNFQHHHPQTLKKLVDVVELSDKTTVSQLQAMTQLTATQVDELIAMAIQENEEPTQLLTMQERIIARLKELLPPENPSPKIGGQIDIVT